MEKQKTTTLGGGRRRELVCGVKGQRLSTGMKLELMTSALRGHKLPQIGRCERHRRQGQCGQPATMMEEPRGKLYSSDCGGELLVCVESSCEREAQALRPGLVMARVQVKQSLIKQGTLGIVYREGVWNDRLYGYKIPGS